MLGVCEPALNRIVAIQACDAKKAKHRYKAGYIIHLSALFLTLFILNKTFILQKNTDEEYFYNTWYNFPDIDRGFVFHVLQSH
jgi:hypothetical protein